MTLCEICSARPGNVFLLVSQPQPDKGADYIHKAKAHTCHVCHNILSEGEHLTVEVITQREYNELPPND